MTLDALDALISTAQACFPDADYLAPNGVLAVRGEFADVSVLRIELPPEQFLHFQSLSVTTADGTDALRTAAVAPSSWHGEYGSRFDPAKLFAFDAPSGTVVHTEADAPAYVDVTFAAPVTLTEVRLRNVATSTAPRARGIRLSTWGGTGQRVIYDAAVREQQLTAVLSDALAHRPEGADPVLIDLVPIVAQTVFGGYHAARTAFDALPDVPDATRREFRALMSRTVLANRDLEWTIHGPQRCFRFWTEQEKLTYLQDALAICDALRELTPKVCFGFGSALAMVRDGGLIPHDDDLDLIVGFDEDEAANLPAAHKLVENWLRPRGFSVSGNFTAHRHVSRPGRKHLDVFVGLFEGDVISWYPSARGILDRNIMYPTSEGTLLGLPCPLPRNPLIYLERVYGPKWRNPDPGFKHSWNRAEYADLVRRKAPERR